MKALTQHLRYRICFSAMVLVVCIMTGPSAFGGVQDPSTANVLRADEFNGDSLGSFWTFINPLNDASVHMTGTQVCISIPGGRPHDQWTTGNFTARLMQPISNGDFDVYVRFDASMNERFQMQGIIIQQNAGNFIRFECHSDGSDLRMFSASFNDSVPSIHHNGVIARNGFAPLYMRVRRLGSMWTQCYSFDGVNWIFGVSFLDTLTTTSLGLYAGNTGTTYIPSFTAMANFLRTLPAVPTPLSSIGAVRLSETAVRAEWTTPFESNNLGFELQRSLGSASEFVTIPNSFVPGSGTSTTPRNYVWVDTTAHPGTWYYRLKQTGGDGTIRYTEGVVVDVVTPVKTTENAPASFELLQNYPNPFNPSTEIKFSVAIAGRTSLRVYNVVGQEVATLFDGVAQAGQSYTVRFEAARFSSGVYFYELESGSNRSIRKMLAVK